MKTALLSGLLLICMILVVGCAHTTEPVLAIAEPESDIGEALMPIGCTRTVVTTGLGLAWKRLNHRISYWDVHPQNNNCPDSMTQQTYLHAGYVGGNWSTGQTASDVPIVKYNYFSVDCGPYAAFYPVAVEMEISGPDYRTRKTVTVSLKEAGIEGFDSYEVFLSGLTLDTDIPQTDPFYPGNYTPDMGYTARGIGAGVERLVVKGATLNFTAWARFELGQADRPGMNDAIPYAKTKAKVHALIMGYKGNIAYTEHGYAVNYGSPLPLMQPDYPHVNSQMRRAYLRGEPGFENNFLALQSFNFRLFGSVENGDYIREISVRTSLLSYDEKTGLAQADVDGFASNASLLTYETMESDFDAELALVQLPGGVSLEGALETQFDTGKTRLLLP